MTQFIRPFIFLIALAFLTDFTGAAIAQPQAMKVRIDKVVQQEVQKRVNVTGSLRAISRAEVAAIEAGKVIEVLVDEADEVKTGQPLARLNKRRLEATLNEQQAQLRSTRALLEANQAQLDNAIWNLDRIKPLFENEMTTEKSVRDAETEVAVNRANLHATQQNIQQIQNRIDLLNIRLEDMVINAPFDGRVVARHIDSGEWVDPGSSVVTLISRDRIEAWIEVPERLKAAAQDHARDIQVNLFEGTETVNSIRTRIIPDVDPRARTFMLVADLDTKDGLLVPGMSVTAWVPAGGIENRKTVSKDALLRNPSGFFVFKAQQGEQGYSAAPVNVTRLYDIADRTVVSSPALQPGDYVVVEGNERLQPMMPIELINAD